MKVHAVSRTLLWLNNVSSVGPELQRERLSYVRYLWLCLESLTPLRYPMRFFRPSRHSPGHVSEQAAMVSRWWRGVRKWLRSIGIVSGSVLSSSWSQDERDSSVEVFSSSAEEELTINAVLIRTQAQASVYSRYPIVCTRACVLYALSRDRASSGSVRG